MAPEVYFWKKNMENIYYEKCISVTRPEQMVSQVSYHLRLQVPEAPAWEQNARRHQRDILCHRTALRFQHRHNGGWQGSHPSSCLIPAQHLGNVNYTTAQTRKHPWVVDPLSRMASQTLLERAHLLERRLFCMFYRWSIARNSTQVYWESGIIPIIHILSVRNDWPIHPQRLKTSGFSRPNNIKHFPKDPIVVTPAEFLDILKNL